MYEHNYVKHPNNFKMCWHTNIIHRSYEYFQSVARQYWLDSDPIITKQNKQIQKG